MLNASDRSHWLKPKGFTLIEVLVVIAIVTLLMTVGLSSFDKLSGVKLSKETNRLAAAVRYTFNRSVALGLYMRMVIDLDTEAFHVEASESPQFLRKTPVEAGLDPDDPENEDVAPGKHHKPKKDKKDKKSSDEAGPLAPTPPEGEPLPGAPISGRARYQQDDVIGPTKLEGGAGVDTVFVGGTDNGINTGKAYIHFLPNGWVEPTVIWTTDGEGTFYTLRINPLTGRVNRQAGKHDPPREFAEPEKMEQEGE